MIPQAFLIIPAGIIICVAAVAVVRKTRCAAHRRNKAWRSVFNSVQFEEVRSEMESICLPDDVLKSTFREVGNPAGGFRLEDQMGAGLVNDRVWR